MLCSISQEGHLEKKDPMAQFASCFMNCLHFFSIWLCVYLLLLMLQMQKGDKVGKEYLVSHLCFSDIA